MVPTIQTKIRTMNLTGKELVSNGIITGVIHDENIQQHGVDLNLLSVYKLSSFTPGGFIPVEGKTFLADRAILMPQSKTTIDDKIKMIWELSAGAYEVKFQQGCKVPSDQRLRIIQRSSILRNGGLLHSSVFDAGFWTDAIGTVMFFFVPIRIEVGARVAQIVSETSNIVTNLYEGQWQGDKQRVDHNDSITAQKHKISC